MVTLFFFDKSKIMQRYLTLENFERIERICAKADHVTTQIKHWSLTGLSLIAVAKAALYFKTGDYSLYGTLVYGTMGVFGTAGFYMNEPRAFGFLKYLSQARNALFRTNQDHVAEQINTNNPSGSQPDYDADERLEDPNPTILPAFDAQHHKAQQSQVDQHNDSQPSLTAPGTHRRATPSS